ncbi:MAG TPA: NapC/NirT family cytochrome c [Anaerolineales bacterium]|jgi:nitrate/TMAO reductase-like tetraheme cytochrome c subunit
MKSLRERLKWPRPVTVDLNKPAHRLWLLAGMLGLLIVGLAIVAGGVQGYLYTESTEFCGTTCHSMYPQYERYQFSAHSKVECAKCHVGAGLQPFIQSKIDGTRQLVATIFDNYSRPIKSPVHNLRPARETCETCHSPATFKDNIAKTIRHYANDEANTLEQTTLVLKMGGWKSSTGISKGIHWHISSEVNYIALDDQRQVIGWVGIRQPDGSMKEFYARDLIGMGQTNFVEEARKKGEVRRLDCIDCHNRAAHYIPYPEQEVDNAITDGLISSSVPFVRQKAVEILSASYKTEADAFAAIDELGATFKNDPKISGETVDQATRTLKALYTQTNFPDMNLDYRTNPNNARHTPTLGCFRCHDGKHVTLGADGKQETISVECNLCHTVPIVGKGSEMLVEAPVIIGDVPDSHTDFRWTIEHRSITADQKTGCYQCHGQAFCNNGACHNLSHPADMAFTHAKEAEKVGQQVCFTCHQDITCTRCHPGGVRDLSKP